MRDEPSRVDLETPDLAAQKRAAFEDLFPGVLTDGVLDASRLGELLDTEVTAPADGRERFGLMWAGKQDAVRSLLAPSRGALIPEFDKSVDFDSASNVFIEGDNLEALKLLQKAYNDKVKLIYIDPPYNTGSNDFIYADDFSDTLRAYLEFTGQLDKSGNRASAVTEVAGRKHSRWLSMMYPRLVLARNLLTQDGILIVSIDDNEVAFLRTILDEVFGQENFLNTFVWVSNLKGRQITGSGAAGTKEYMLVYARDSAQVGAFRASARFLKSLMPAVYKGFDYSVKEDERGPYVTKNELYNTNSAFNEATRPNLVYDIYFQAETGTVKTEPVTTNHLHDGYAKVGPKPNNNGVHRYHAFRWSRQKVERESYDLEFVPSGSSYKVYTKVRDVDSTSIKDLLMDISTSDGSRDLANLGLDPNLFDYPKPVRLIQSLCAFGTSRDSLVLDFFAGSGTTAEAVLRQNVLDGGSRRFIAIQLPEPTDSKEFATIADAARTRIVTAIEKVQPESSLRSFRLGESYFRDPMNSDTADLFDLRESTLNDGDHVMDEIAGEILLKEGVSLDAPWARVQAGDATMVTAGGVGVVMSLEITEIIVTEALALRPRVLVFLEDGFAGRDVVKANAFTNARNLGITMKTV